MAREDLMEIEFRDTRCGSDVPTQHSTLVLQVTKEVEDEPIQCARIRGRCGSVRQYGLWRRRVVVEVRFVEFDDHVAVGVDDL